MPRPRFLLPLLFVLAGLTTAVPAVELIENDSPAALTALGNEATQALQFDRAISLYKRALTKDPNYVFALFNLGVVHQQQGDLDQANEYYTQALNLQPDNAHALNNAGIITYRRQDYRLAIKHFSAAANVATNLPGDTADYFFNLATTHERLEEWLLAQKAYNNALSHDPQHFGSHYNLGTLYLGSLANPALAEQHLKAAHRINPGRPEPLLNMAMLSERFTRGKDPEIYYTEAIRVAPAGSTLLATALWKRATYYDRLKPPRKLDMRNDLLQVLEIDPHYPGANGSLGLYYESLADYDRAITYLEKEIEDEYDDPKHPIDLECHYTLSQIYTDHRFNLRKALEHAKAYQAQRPGSAAARRLGERIALQQLREVE